MQTYPNWEILLLTIIQLMKRRVIKKYNHLNLRHLCIENSGIIAKSRNLVFNMPMVIGSLLDSDDWWTGDKLQSSVDIIKSDGRSFTMI